MPPKKTLATLEAAGVKGDKIRITYHLGCNASGTDKLPPLVIGFSAKPRPFGHHTAAYFGFDYKYNPGPGWPQ